MNCFYEMVDRQKANQLTCFYITATLAFNVLTLIWLGFLGVRFAGLKLVRIMLEVHKHTYFLKIYLLVPRLF